MAGSLREAADKIRARTEAAETTWKPAYVTPHDDSGLITTVTSNANVKVAMPNWPGAAKLNSSDKAKWDSFMAALRKHEDGHVALA
jgi:predicted secreted Zn-dependent protease